jgi:hypothetical protein
LSTSFSGAETLRLYRPLLALRKLGSRTEPALYLMVTANLPGTGHLETNNSPSPLSGISLTPPLAAHTTLRQYIRRVSTPTGSGIWCSQPHLGGLEKNPEYIRYIIVLSRGSCPCVPKYKHTARVPTVPPMASDLRIHNADATAKNVSSAGIVEA